MTGVRGWFRRSLGKSPGKAKGRESPAPSTVVTLGSSLTLPESRDSRSARSSISQARSSVEPTSLSDLPSFTLSIAPPTDSLTPQLSLEHTADENDDAQHDLWQSAYDVLKEREPGLMADYETHLRDQHVEAGADLGSSLKLTRAVVQQLLDDRKKKQWKIPVVGKDMNVREQIEKLSKFLLWSDGIIKTAVSSQPYAALAWSGATMLLPLLTTGSMHDGSMLEGFRASAFIQMYWNPYEQDNRKTLGRQDYQNFTNSLIELYTLIIGYQARVICHLSSSQLDRAWQKVAGGNDWDGRAKEMNTMHDRCKEQLLPLQQREQYDRQLQEAERLYIVKEKLLRVMIEARQDDNERRLLHDLASAISTYEADKNFNPGKVKGTCEWFFTDPRFCNWRESELSSLLWVSAGPGCGKSVLSRALIDEDRLVNTITTITILPASAPAPEIYTSQTNSSTVCYFFFKDGDERRMNGAYALCAILHQLFSNPNTSHLIKHALLSHKNYGQALAQNFSELWRILVDCVTSSDAVNITCVLDALDECYESSRREIIRNLKKFYLYAPRPTRSKLKFLITSRPYDDLEASFKDFSVNTAYLRFDGDDKHEEIGHDINLVIEDKVSKVGRSFKPEHQKQISNRLKSMRNRTYLWLHLTFDIIEKTPSEYSKKSDIEGVLANLPSQVTDAYERILDRSTNREKAENLLQIVLAAKAPLTLDQANHALTLASKKGKFSSFVDFQEDLWHGEFKEVAKNICGLLINVHDSKLYFLHQTVREFLLDTFGTGKQWKGRFSMTGSHSTMSRCCLDYLLMPGLPDCDYSVKGQAHTFIYYAAENWRLHYNSQDRIAQDKFCLDAQALCHPSRTTTPNAWVWLPSLQNPGLEEQFQSGRFWNDLTVASYFGLFAVVDNILSNRDRPNDPASEYYGFALLQACKQCHEDVVQLFINKGSDFDAKSGDGLCTTVASAVAGEGSLKAVQLLLNHVKVTKGLLMATAGNWNEGQEIMEFLFEKYGDKITITEGLLMAAVRNWRQGRGIMEFLFEKYGDKITITEGLLMAAVRNWRQGRGIMEFLFEKYGDKITITEGLLMAAARNWRQGRGIMKFLFEKYGDKITITEGLLMAAVRNWRQGQEIVKFLFEKYGDKITITEGLLMAAVRNWRQGQGIMEFLFEKYGDEITITEGLLMAAAQSYGGHRILGLITDQREHDIIITERVLDAAVRSGQSETLKWLVKHMNKNLITEEIAQTAALCCRPGDLDLLSQQTDAAIDWARFRRIAEFSSAAKDGDAHLIEKLLKDGIDPNMRYKNGRTALCMATSCGHVDAVKALLQRTDVDVNSVSDYGRSPLWCACDEGHKQIVYILLEAGADPCIGFCDGLTPIAAARQHGDLEIVEMFDKFRRKRPFATTSFHCAYPL